MVKAIVALILKWQLYTNARTINGYFCDMMPEPCSEITICKGPNQISVIVYWGPFHRGFMSF